MPRSKRHVRASGVARSLGAGRLDLITCVYCDRRLPRDAIAHIGRTPITAGKHKGKPRAACGECWAPGGKAWHP